MTIVHSFCVDVKTLMVPLPWNESWAIIKTQIESRMYFLANLIRVVVKVQKVLKFEGVMRAVLIKMKN
jgi:hypothetical protein